MTGGGMHVTGGAGGTYAHVEDLRTLARDSDDLAVALGGAVVECHVMLADPALIATGLVDPVGLAAFSRTLLGALDGGGGLVALAAAYAHRAVGLRAVAASYRTVDRTRAQALDGVRWTAGRIAAALLPSCPAPLGAAITVLAGTRSRSAPSPLSATAPSDPVPGAVGTAATRCGSIVERVLTRHPALVDDLAGAGPGLISGLTNGQVADVRAASRLLGLLYPDGRPAVADLGSDPAGTPPPTCLGDLMDALTRRGRGAGADADRIDVRVVTHPDGGRGFIVDIPGTGVLNAPGGFTGATNDMGTNVHTLAGDVTARECAVAEALRRAGARPTDPVMLVGHSQGGMVAAQAACDSARGTFGFRVTHVLTAGSPIGRVAVPSDVQVLALENAHDIVPHLDAAGNPDRPNWTTVSFDTQLGGVGANHGMASAYLPATRELDLRTDPSVAAYRASAGAFLSAPGDGARVRTLVYGLSRQR